MDLMTFILASLIVCIGAMIQGSVGIGLGFVAVPLLILLDERFVPGPLLFAALFLTIMLSYREYHAMDKYGIKWASIGRLIGTMIASLLLTALPQQYLGLLFAGIIIIAVILSVSGFKLEITPASLISTGTLSGFMGTTAAIGGVPLALLYQRYQGPRLRGTLSGIFVIGTVISLIFLNLIGRFGFFELKLALVLLPGILFGFIISGKTARLLDEGWIRPTVLLLAILSAVAVIIKNM
jgi:uncharacterized membrane protein YfcA